MFLYLVTKKKDLKDILNDKQKKKSFGKLLSLFICQCAVNVDILATQWCCMGITLFLLLCEQTKEIYK